MGGKLVLLMKITSCKNKWTVNANNNSCIPASFFFFFSPAGCLSWMRGVEYESFFSVFRSVLTKVVSTAKSPREEQPETEEHFNVALYPLSSTSDYTIDFFFPPVVPAIAAITIYLGSLFHYSRAAVKPEEKCCVLWFMEAIWPVLIRGIYECDAEFGNGLWALLSVNMAFREDGMGVSADWKTNMTQSEQCCWISVLLPHFTLLLTSWFYCKCHRRKSQL